MSMEKDRLHTAQWILERNLAWIAAAEVKVGVIVAIDTAMLGGLGATFSAANSAALTHWAWALFFVIAAAICLGSGLFCSAMVVLPRITGPENSLLFFGRVGPCVGMDYSQKLKTTTDAELLEDWAAQIHRNAQIACDKYAWVKKSMWWSFLSLLPWFSAIILLLEKK